MFRAPPVNLRPVKSCCRRGSLWKDPNVHRLKNSNRKTRLGSHLSAQTLCPIYVSSTTKCVMWGVRWVGTHWKSSREETEGIKENQHPVSAIRLALLSDSSWAPQTFTTFLFAEKRASLDPKRSHAIVQISLLLEIKIKFKSNFTFHKEGSILILPKFTRLWHPVFIYLFTNIWVPVNFKALCCRVGSLPSRSLWSDVEVRYVAFRPQHTHQVPTSIAPTLSSSASRMFSSWKQSPSPAASDSFTL